MAGAIEPAHVPRTPTAAEPARERRREPGRAVRRTGRRGPGGCRPHVARLLGNSFTLAAATSVLAFVHQLNLRVVEIEDAVPALRGYRSPQGQEAAAEAVAARGESDTPEGNADVKAAVLTAAAGSGS